MFKRTIAVAMSVVGLIVGAGFSSGQEVLQYFVAFGKMGIWGAVIVAVLMSAAGMIVLQLGSYFQADEHAGVLRTIGTTTVSWILDIGIVFTLFSVGFVMLAGGGSNLNQQFGIPSWVGSAILLVLVLAAGMLDADRVSTVIGAITPFIVVALVGAAIWAYTHTDGSLSSLEPLTQNVDTNLPNWWISALNYAGLVLMVNVAMAIVIGGSHLYPREAGHGGLVGGITFGVLLIISTLSLFLKIKTVQGSDLPMLTLVDDVHPALGVVMSLIIYGMIFNTCLGLFYSLGRRLTAHHPEKFRIVFTVVTVIGFAVSFFGFRTLLSSVYPIMGYVGFVLIALLFIAWFRGRTAMHDEGGRRQEARELAERKLDPNVRFTSKQARRLRHLIGDSNLDDDELRKLIRDDVTSDTKTDEAPEPEEIDEPDADAKDSAGGDIGSSSTVSNTPVK